MKSEEKQLIIKAQEGDTWAFEKLVSKYDRQVLSLAYKMVGNPEDAQDVYQESLIAVYKALPKFRLESNFFTWFYRITVNNAINFKRKAVRNQTQPLTSDREESRSEDHRIEYSDQKNPENKLQNKELKEKIIEAVALLPDRERMAFVLCHEQGYKIREAAELMSCTEGSIKSYLFRAREKMKKSLYRYLKN